MGIWVSGVCVGPGGGGSVIALVWFPRRGSEFVAARKIPLFFSLFITPCTQPIL